MEKLQGFRMFQKGKTSCLHENHWNSSIDHGVTNPYSTVIPGNQGRSWLHGVSEQLYYAFHFNTSKTFKDQFYLNSWL